MKASRTTAKQAAAAGPAKTATRAPAPQFATDPTGLLDLQRHAGNRAVRALLDGASSGDNRVAPRDGKLGGALNANRTKSFALKGTVAGSAADERKSLMASGSKTSATTAHRKSTSDVRATGKLQRKCACGGNKSAFSESCSDCEAASLQRKLAVGSRDDVMEMEADAIAARIAGPRRFTVSPAGPLPIAGSPSSLQGVGPEVPDSVNAEISRGGTMLEADLRKEMESSFGYDFSQVRVHAGAMAAQSARDVNALAYTVGHDIVFGTNQFAPHTHEGRRLLAHELTHVVQQTRPNATSLVQRDVDKRAGAPPNDANPPIVIFVADPKLANDVAFAKRQGEADAARILKRGIDAKDRQTLNAKLKFFSGDARKVYGDLIRPALEEVFEIQMPAADMRIQSYVFAGDPHRKGSEIYARELARDLGARIRENRGSRPTAEQQLEFEATGKFFVGEARAVYVQETNEWREKRDPSISRLVKEGIEEIDGSARWRVLASQVLAMGRYDPKRGLRQWAIEMKAVPHGRKGNYLLAFFEELVNDHFFDQLDESRDDALYWRVAREVVHELDAQGVDVRELYLARTLAQLSAYEQSKYATIDINKYHIYDWKRALGAPLEPIVEAINIILHFLPVIGQVLGAVEGLLGRELLTGRKLAAWERLLGFVPYAGRIFRAGKATAGIVAEIARTSNMKPTAILRLLKGASETAVEVDRLREIKRLVDTHSLLSAEHRNLLSSAISRFRPVEQEARAAGLIQEVDEASTIAKREAGRVASDEAADAAAKMEMRDLTEAEVKAARGGGREGGGSLIPGEDLNKFVPQEKPGMGPKRRLTPNERAGAMKIIDVLQKMRGAPDLDKQIAQMLEDLAKDGAKRKIFEGRLAEIAKKDKIARMLKDLGGGTLDEAKFINQLAEIGNKDERIAKMLKDLTANGEAGGKKFMNELAEFAKNVEKPPPWEFIKELVAKELEHGKLAQQGWKEIYVTEAGVGALNQMRVLFRNVAGGLEARLMQMH